MKLESNSNRLLKGKSEAAVLQSALKELIPITSKIRRAKVATAYIDAAALFHFLSHIESAADGKSGASVEIYVQRSSLQSLCRELRLLGPVDAKLEKPWRRRLQEALKRDGEKNNFGQVHLSIFSVSFGTLFHSKAIFLETNNSHRAIVGSINLTANGLTNNEELFVSSEDLKDRITIDSKFIKSVDAYISRKSLTSKSESIGEGTVITLTELIANQEPITTDSLRSVLIEVGFGMSETSYRHLLSLWRYRNKLKSSPRILVNQNYLT
jgi:phosphatidylserine/phosphatidylglycerophosphate/cardiolipin synthase-like enzyme